jgi:glycosyltransferase involved in cell wall biosynthesis
MGDAGLIVPEADVCALADALRRLMHDPGLRRDLADKGRQRILAQYTQAEVAAQTVAAYRALIAQP